MTDKLKELIVKLPKNLKSDWDGTNHYELTMPDNVNTYWWLIIHGQDCDSEFGKHLGLLLDIAEELSKEENQ